MNSNNIGNNFWTNLQISWPNVCNGCLAEGSEEDVQKGILELDRKQGDQEGLAELELKEDDPVGIVEQDLSSSCSDPLAVNDNAEIKHPPKSRQMESSRQLLDQAINSLNPSDQMKFYRQMLNHAITDLKPSDSDLTLTLRDYVLSESLKILKKQGDREPNSYFYFLKVVLHLFSDFNLDHLVAYLNLLCKNSDFKAIEVSLFAIFKYGRSFLDKPLYEIQLIKSPCKNNPQESILNAMRLCLDWTHITVHYANDHLKTVNENVEQIKKDAKVNEKSSKFVEGFDANSFKEFSKLRNLHSNIQIIDDFTKPSLSASMHQLLNSSNTANDFLYLKFKYKKGVFNCLKSMLSQIEITNRRITDALEKSVEFYRAARISQVKYLKKGIQLYIGEEPKLEESCSFENLQNKPVLLGKSLEAIEAWYSELCNQYEAISGKKSDADINNALTWLMFGDEINEAKEAIKVVSNKENSKNALQTNNSGNKKNPNRRPQSKNIKQPVTKPDKATTAKEKSQNKQINSNSSLTLFLPHNATSSDLNQGQILENHSVFIDELTKKIKKDLHLKCKEVQLSGMELSMAKRHSKELRDHLKYASLNFDLFCKAIESKDLYAMGAIVPFLFVDQHLAIEQMLKRQIAVNKMELCNSHNLSEIYLNSPCMINPDQKSFIGDFSDAMLQARYPVSWMHKLQNEKIPGPLKWMQYSQNLCDAINMADITHDNSFDHVDLINLCSFVFDSYAMTLQCIFQELNPESEIQQSYAEVSKCLQTLKGMLESSISSNKDNFFAAAVKTKNSRPVSKDKNPILKTRQDLLEVGQNILNGLKHDKAISGIILEEASNHLGRINAVDYLQNNHGELRYAALHHRNLLMFQWIYEQLYRFNGYVAGRGELSWSCNHNLELFHAFVFPNESSKTLPEFNFVRNVHYNHENGAGKSLAMIKELLDTRKILKNLDSADWLRSDSKKCVTKNIEIYKKTFKDNRLQILEKGKAQLESILYLTKSADFGH